MTTPHIEEMHKYIDSTVHAYCDYNVYSELKDLLSAVEEENSTALTKAHQAGIDEAVEIVQSVRIEGNNRHANDKTEDQRDYLNDWILPAVKKEIIKALQDNK